MVKSDFYPCFEEGLIIQLLRDTNATVLHLHLKAHYAYPSARRRSDETDYRDLLSEQPSALMLCNRSTLDAYDEAGDRLRLLIPLASGLLPGAAVEGSLFRPRTLLDPNTRDIMSARAWHPRSS
jgi:hypothetical protein